MGVYVIGVHVARVIRGVCRSKRGWGIGAGVIGDSYLNVQCGQRGGGGRGERTTR